MRTRGKMRGRNASVALNTHLVLSARCPRDDVVGIDSVPKLLGHLPPVLIHNKSVRENGLVGRLRHFEVRLEQS